MMKEEIRLMKSNEVVAEAAVRAGCDGFFGYPITPQTEIMETLMELKPWETTGMVVVQAESEVASINMLYGGAAAGKRVMTSSSSPGISLMCEGISYLAGAELPCVIVDVMRGGPGLGTIQPSQSDYFQVVKGGGHGDYKLIVLAPASVQEMYDFVETAFELAFKYRTPAVILSDGLIGQMMEKVTLRAPKPRMTDEFIQKNYGHWALTGRKGGRPRNVATSLCLDPLKQEQTNHRLQDKYREIEKNEVRYDSFMTDDCQWLLVAYGSSARICHKVVEMARKEGIKVGLLRPITLFPFPYEPIASVASHCKGIMSVELSAGQMVEDVKLAVNGQTPVHHFGRMGGAIHSPEEVFEAFKKQFSL